MTKVEPWIWRAVHVVLFLISVAIIWFGLRLGRQLEAALCSSAPFHLYLASCCFVIVLAAKAALVRRVQKRWNAEMERQRAENEPIAAFVRSAYRAYRARPRGSAVTAPTS